VPDYPPEILSATAAAIDAAFMRALASTGDCPEGILARAALDAAAPPLAAYIAETILAHAERQHPRDPERAPTAWDRHFLIAARVAAGAFTTDGEMLRMAAEAIEAGNFRACYLDDAGRMAIPADPLLAGAVWAHDGTCLTIGCRDCGYQGTERAYESQPGGTWLCSACLSADGERP
jgi:hypothetical protein